MMIHLRRPGEDVLEGISVTEAAFATYVDIRKGGQGLEIRIPRSDPKNYSIDVLIKDSEKSWAASKISIEDWQGFQMEES